MKTTYVSIAYTGSYEDKDSEVLYAGQDYEKAKEAGRKALTPNDKRYNFVGETNVWIEHWEDGKKIKTINSGRDYPNAKTPSELFV